MNMNTSLKKFTYSNSNYEGAYMIDVTRTAKTRVVVVDDHPLFRQGVIQSLEADKSITVVGEGCTAEDALKLAIDKQPDVLLLDISMPGGGIVAAKNISFSCPHVRIGMLTVSENDDDVTRALQGGAHGYILKGIGGPDLIGVVKSLKAGERYVSPVLAAQLLTDAKITSKTESEFPFTDLTAREEQILNGIAQGLSNREIGEKLCITEKTVKNYVTNVLQKLHVRNRVEAAVLVRNKTATSI